MKKKNAIITFISVATLLALFDVNDRVVHADTIRGESILLQQPIRIIVLIPIKLK
ncbi:hypothetical protein AAFS18_09170 [Lactobacillus crispatus]